MYIVYWLYFYFLLFFTLQPHPGWRPGLSPVQAPFTLISNLVYLGRIVLRRTAWKCNSFHHQRRSESSATSTLAGKLNWYYLPWFKVKSSFYQNTKEVYLQNVPIFTSVTKVTICVFGKLTCPRSKDVNSFLSGAARRAASYNAKHHRNIYIIYSWQSISPKQNGTFPNFKNT